MQPRLSPAEQTRLQLPATTPHWRLATCATRSRSFARAVACHTFRAVSAPTRLAARLLAESGTSATPKRTPRCGSSPILTASLSPRSSVRHRATSLLVLDRRSTRRCRPLTTSSLAQSCTMYWRSSRALATCADEIAFGLIRTGVRLRRQGSLPACARHGPALQLRRVRDRRSERGRLICTATKPARG